MLIFRSVKKKSTKVTSGIWGVIPWYQSLGIRIPRELGCGVHKHDPDTSFIVGY